jgi:hypothetical protein
MTALAFWAVGIIILAYALVWSRPKQVEQAPEPPVIDRRWRVFDRADGGYNIVVEAVV